MKTVANAATICAAAAAARAATVRLAAGDAAHVAARAFAAHRHVPAAQAANPDAPR